MNKNFLDLEKYLNYSFKERGTLKLALIHKSYGNENARYKNINNEKLELLGDAVLDLIVTEYLYQKYKNAKEGELSKLKSMIVSEPSLAKIAKTIRIGEYLILGRGEEKTGGRERSSLLCDGFESVLGAIFVDGGYGAAKQYVMYHIKDMIENISHSEDITDYKSILQEYCQHKFKEIPVYEVLADEGPSHRKNFKIIVGILPGVDVKNLSREQLIPLLEKAEFTATGEGSNKKTATQLAARDLCKKLEVIL
ncbi:MAG: ribonuclease III [Fusobacteriaceae bacterium]|jgi:ribonuclease-3|nr:ribonuclease III [Fusobacteriaceae bacterium]